jgi:hypothetical protein
MRESEQHQVCILWWKVPNIQSCDFDKTRVDEKRKEDKIREDWHK